MTVRVSPQEAVEKWKRRTTAATQDYARGVQNVTQAPGEKAAQQADAYASGVQRAVAEGRWQRNVAKVSLEDWKRAAIDKGVQRIGSGVEGATSKMEEIMPRLLANVEKAQAAANRIPRGSFEANMQRMVAFATEMHNNPVK